MGMIETTVDIPAEHQANVFGQFDAFAKKIERTLHVTLIARDDTVKILGEETVALAGEKVYWNSLRRLQDVAIRFRNRT